MEIKVKIIRTYGVDRNYPVCDKAILFAEIAGASTLTDNAIKAIKSLGYAVNVVQEVKSL